MNSWLPPHAWNLVTVALVGLCLGSFLNVVIYRLPLGLSLAGAAAGATEMAPAPSSVM